MRIGGFAYSKRGRKAGDKGVWESYGEYPVREVLGGVIEVRNQIVACGLVLSSLVVESPRLSRHAPLHGS